MKEIIGKLKTNESNLPRKITVNNKEIKRKNDIANEFNTFFSRIGLNLAKKIPQSTILFENYLKKANSSMDMKSLSINELKEAFFSLKMKKSSGYDEINYDVIRKCFNELMSPLKFLFDFYLERRIFPNKLTIASDTNF